MKEQFIPYLEALELQELGFDEECLATYHKELHTIIPIYGKFTNQDVIKAPLYQQVFKWFRDEHKAEHTISRIPQGAVEASNKRNKLLKPYSWYISKEDLNPSIPKEGTGFADTYEEAELACLKKLIELINE